MGMKLCKRCKSDITGTHYNRKYCRYCAIQHKKEYNKNYFKQFPKSARGKYYKYYKFLLTLTEDELSALYIAKKTASKEKNAEVQEIKAQMVLINEAYKRMIE